MNTAPDFTEQIRSWLLSIHFQCELIQPGIETFARLQISKDGHLILELKLIDVKNWNFERSYEELNIYKVRQAELRRSGIHSVTIWEDLWAKKGNIIKSRIGLSF